jgi:hypothetical protein
MIVDCPFVDSRLTLKIDVAGRSSEEDGDTKKCLVRLYEGNYCVLVTASEHLMWRGQSREHIDTITPPVREVPKRVAEAMEITFTGTISV